MCMLRVSIWVESNRSTLRDSRRRRPIQTEAHQLGQNDQTFCEHLESNVHLLEISRKSLRSVDVTDKPNY